MNAKATRKILNAAFKQFQRLPEWPVVKMSGARWVSEDADTRKDQASRRLRGFAVEIRA